MGKSFSSPRPKEFAPGRSGISQAFSVPGLTINRVMTAGLDNGIKFNGQDKAVTICRPPSRLQGELDFNAKKNSTHGRHWIQRGARHIGHLANPKSTSKKNRSTQK